MIKVLITTSTFNKNILNRLLKKKINVITNKTGKKVDENFLKKILVMLI